MNQPAPGFHFNGAATCQVAEGDLHYEPSLGVRRFNGAATCQVAEATESGSGRTRAETLQWGRDVLGRGRDVSAIVLKVIDESFNGAATCQVAEVGPPRCQCWPRPLSFNGAATCQVAEDRFLWTDTFAQLVELQWGRDVLGRGSPGSSALLR